MQKVIKKVGLEEIVADFGGNEEVSCQWFILRNVFSGIGNYLIDLLEKYAKFSLDFKTAF